MTTLRMLLPAILALSAHPLSAETPLDRVQTGFRSLGTGAWDTALREWTRDGTWVDVEGRLKLKLEGWISNPRAIGRWEAFNPPHLTTLWQRHWMMASFDQGAVFLTFDFVAHKGQWRLVGLQATQDPAEALPHVDLLPVVQASRNP